MAAATWVDSERVVHELAFGQAKTMCGINGARKSNSYKLPIPSTRRTCESCKRARAIAEGRQ